MTPTAMNAVQVSQGDPLLLTPGQVASRLQVSAAWVRDHATRKEPRIPSVKVGKLLRFRPADIEQFIREQCA